MILTVDGVSIGINKKLLTDRCKFLNLGNQVDQEYASLKTEKNPQLFAEHCNKIIKETKPEVMSAVLRYLYTGKVEIKPTLFPEFLRSCKKLMLTDRARIGMDLMITSETAGQWKEVAKTMTVEEAELSSAITRQVELCQTRSQIPSSAIKEIAKFSAAPLNEPKKAPSEPIEQKKVGTRVSNTILNLIKVAGIFLKVGGALIIGGATFYATVLFLFPMSATALFLPTAFALSILMTMGIEAPILYDFNKIKLSTAIAMGVAGLPMTISSLLIRSAYNDAYEIGKSFIPKGEQQLNERGKLEELSQGSLIESAGKGRDEFTLATVERKLGPTVIASLKALGTVGLISLVAFAETIIMPIELFILFNFFLVTIPCVVINIGIFMAKEDYQNWSKEAKIAQA